MHATADEIRTKLRPLLAKFQTALGYTNAKAEKNRCALFEGMRQEAARIGIPYPEGSHSWYTFHAGANYAYFCYANLPLEVRIYAGIFTWLAVLVDDEAQQDPDEWYQFVPRFLAGGENLHHSKFAVEWDRWLRRSYQLYAPLAANFIITSGLNFVNACAVEGSEIPRMTHSKGGDSWAWYFRDKNGFAEAYAYMAFPRAICPDIAYYMEAIPDMVRYLCLTNDVMSFYKEECACDTDNYMHSRASYEGVNAYEVLKQVIEEAVDAHRRITLVLEGKEPYARLWNDHALGYVAFHKTSERYKLRDLGLAENLP